MFLTGALYNLYVRYIMNQHKVKGLAGQTSVISILCCLQIMKVIFLSYICKKAAEEVIYLV